jgi:hydrogenase maturation factor HypE
MKSHSFPTICSYTACRARRANVGINGVKTRNIVADLAVADQLRIVRIIG